MAFHFIEKHTPYLSLLVSLSFSRNNVCKNAVFFLAVSFPKKAFVIPNNRISKARICRQCWFKKISRKRKTKQQKKLRGNVFSLSPRSHAKIELIWMRKKIRPKKSLRYVVVAQSPSIAKLIFSVFNMLDLSRISFNRKISNGQLL